MMLDDVSLDERGEGTGDRLALEGDRVVRNRDVLGTQLSRHHDPDDEADDDQSDSADDSEDPHDLDALRSAGRRDGILSGVDAFGHEEPSFFGMDAITVRTFRIVLPSRRPEISTSGGHPRHGDLPWDARPSPTLTDS